MRSKRNVETTKLKVGETLKKEFNTYLHMAQSAVDWTLFCSYQMRPNYVDGIHKIIQLPSIQIAYSKMVGGIMFDFVVPEDVITLSVMKNISKQACIDQMKLKTGMITVLDDKKIYNLNSSEEIEILDISINKNANPVLIKKLKKAVDLYYIDKDKKLETLINEIISKYLNQNNINDNISQKIESKIIQAIWTLTETQEIQIPQFTKSERIALEIKKKFFNHMDHNLSIATLAENHNISTKSLQNAFRSLYDLTPNQFSRLLKLNLVHHELLLFNSQQTSVQKIAQKWGFRHMGRFSKFYTELFLENPSITLKKSIPFPDGMNKHCVKRKEEII